MIFLNKFRINSILVFFLLIGVSGSWTSSGYGQDRIEDIGLRSEYLREFSLEDQYEQKSSKKYFFVKGEEKLQIEKIEGIDQQSSDTLTDSEIMSIQALYANALSAYPGEVSNKIVCNDQFKPVYREKITDEASYKYFLLHSTERFGLGACTEDVIKYKHVVGWVFCSQKNTLFIIKYFVPLSNTFNDLEHIFLSFSC